MIKSKKIPIRFQFAIFLILFTFALVASLLFFMIKDQTKVLTKERITVGQTLSAHFAASARDAILLDDDLYVYDIINDILTNDSDKDIKYIFITSPTGKVIIHNETSQLGDTLHDSVTNYSIKSNMAVMQHTIVNGEPIIDFSRPITENVTKKCIGFARIGISEQSIKRLINKSIKDSVSLAFIILLFGLLASLLWVRLVSKPISELAKGAKIIGTGDLQYRFNISTRNELGELATIFNQMTSNLYSAQIELLSKQKIDHELDLARALQATLLPSTLPLNNKFEIAAWYSAAKQVGGDYYDFIDIDEDHLGVVIGDVSGKSITGAFMMGITRAIMRTVAPNELSPRKTLIKLNEALCQNLRRGMFVTMMYIVLNKKTLHIKLASAGHDPLFYFTNKSKKYQLINPAGCAIGVNRDSFASKLEESEIYLSENDTIALTTDGINEATIGDGTFFGEDRMYTYLANAENSSPEIILNKLISELSTYYNGSEPSDDATIVILKVKQLLGEI